MSIIASVAVSLLTSTVVSSVLSTVLSHRYSVDSRLWNARVSAYSKLLGKLLAWVAYASPTLAEVRSGDKRRPVDPDSVRADLSEALLLSTAELSGKLEEFAVNSALTSEALDEINDLFERSSGSAEVDVESEAAFARLKQLQEQRRALKEQVMTCMRRELGLWG